MHIAVEILHFKPRWAEPRLLVYEFLQLPCQAGRGLLAPGECAAQCLCDLVPGDIPQRINQWRFPVDVELGQDVLQLDQRSAVALQFQPAIDQCGGGVAGGGQFGEISRSPFDAGRNGALVVSGQTNALRTRVQVEAHFWCRAMQREHAVFQPCQRNQAVRRQRQRTVKYCLERGKGSRMQRRINDDTHVRL